MAVNHGHFSLKMNPLWNSAERNKWLPLPRSELIFEISQDSAKNELMMSLTQKLFNFVAFFGLYCRVRTIYNNYQVDSPLIYNSAFNFLKNMYNKVCALLFICIGACQSSYRFFNENCTLPLYWAVSRKSILNIKLLSNFPEFTHSWCLLVPEVKLELYTSTRIY